MNDPTVPVSFETLKNCKTEMRCEASTKRGTYVFEPPQTIQVRRSDDAMQIRCTAKGTEEVLTQTVESDYEGGKMTASVLFLDFGITDSITEHAPDISAQRDAKRMHRRELSTKYAGGGLQAPPPN